jgi:uncharacterized membrane protein
MKVNPHKSSTGMDANTLALLCYIGAFVLSWIPVIKWVAWAVPLVIFFIEKGSPFVKFHAMQALLLEAVNFILGLVLGIISGVVTAAYLSSIYSYDSFGAGAGGLMVIGALSVIIGIAITVFAIIALIKAGGYYEYKLPVIGNLAQKWSRKGMPM